MPPAPIHLLYPLALRNDTPASVFDRDAACGTRCGDRPCGRSVFRNYTMGPAACLRCIRAASGRRRGASCRHLLRTIARHRTRGGRVRQPLRPSVALPCIRRERCPACAHCCCSSAYWRWPASPRLLHRPSCCHSPPWQQARPRFTPSPSQQRSHGGATPPSPLARWDS